MTVGKTLRKIVAKRQRRAAALIDRDHELVLTPERLREDVMIYRTADGQERMYTLPYLYPKQEAAIRCAVLDHSRIVAGR